MGISKTGLVKSKGEDFKRRERIFQGGRREHKTIEERQPIPGRKMKVDYSKGVFFIALWKGK